MKKTKIPVILLTIIIVFTILTACGNVDEAEDSGNEPVEIPDAVQGIMKKTADLAASYALQLDGEWADEYAACLESGEGRDYEKYDDLKATLDQIRLECGAYYVYILTDFNEDDGYFELTVDGSPEEDEWMTKYETEGQFLKASDGYPCSSLLAWDNGTNDPVWSAFAPVYDSAGNVVGILGIDYPAPEIIDYPEWNRDSAEWNGMIIEY